MSWWNDLWLNEGFATYMQYMSLQTVLPKLDIVSSHIWLVIKSSVCICQRFDVDKVVCFATCLSNKSYLCRVICSWLFGSELWTKMH